MFRVIIFNKFYGTLFVYFHSSITPMKGRTYIRNNLCINIQQKLRCGGVRPQKKNDEIRQFYNPINLVFVLIYMPIKKINLAWSEITIFNIRNTLSVPFFLPTCFFIYYL